MPMHIHGHIYVYTHMYEYMHMCICIHTCICDRASHSKCSEAEYVSLICLSNVFNSFLIYGGLLLGDPMSSFLTHKAQEEAPVTVLHYTTAMD